MPDLKPPRGAGDERETLTGLLQFQRESLARKVTGVDEVAARTSAVGSGTTLIWLVKHLSGAEVLWVLGRFAGQAVELTPQHVGAADTVASAVASYRATWDRVDEIVAASELDEPCRDPEYTDVNLRWVLMHLLEETARHAGHADILRELIDGDTGR